MKIIRQLPPQRWEEYKKIKIMSVQTENLAFSESLDKLNSRTDEEWQKELETLEEEHKILIFVENTYSRIVGFAGAHIHKNPRLAHNAFFSSLYVLPEFRNKGLGRQLIEERITLVKEKYPSTTNLHCEIVTTQLASIEIHKRLGFVIAGEIKNLFKINDQYYSEYWMQKSIE